MKFSLAHANINVTDLEKSLTFYEKALGMRPVGGKDAADGSFKLVYIAAEDDSVYLELTWLRDKEGPYELGDNESHIAFVTEDYAAAHALHEEMGCICFENPAMGIYFIEDPDGYWLEVLPKK